jgi:hypothetical protein
MLEAGVRNTNPWPHSDAFLAVKKSFLQSLARARMLPDAGAPDVEGALAYS